MHKYTIKKYEPLFQADEEVFYISFILPMTIEISTTEPEHDVNDSAEMESKILQALNIQQDSPYADKAREAAEEIVNQQDKSPLAIQATLQRNGFTNRTKISAILRIAANH